MMGDALKNVHKLVQHNNTVYQIPIRDINGEQVLLLSDLQLLLPNATALLSHSKLIPFQLDPDNLYTELLPKRIPIVNHSDAVWEAHVPEDSTTQSLIQTHIELQIKLDQLSEKLDRLLGQEVTIATENDNETADANDCTDIVEEGIEAVTVNDTVLDNQPEHEENASSSSSSSNNGSSGTHLVQQQNLPQQTGEPSERSHSPPPAFSSSSHAPSSSGSHRHEAPPSYETSVLSTIKALNSKLRLYEEHIYNRHKSPKWLAKRAEWIARVPNSVEEVAYQLVQLEMALLWSAVTESWIQERETWLTLVASARSERHLAGALINLERYTLVMDDDWASVRERWINDLLEMVVLPLSHG